MNKKSLYKAWAILYTLCAGLGLVENAIGFWKFLLILISLALFAPPFCLAIRAKKEGDFKTLKILRIVSLCSLVLTLVFLVLNFFSIYFSTEAGLWLYVLLVLVSSPMVCMQYWALSLFLWACLLFYALFTRKK